VVQQSLITKAFIRDIKKIGTVEMAQPETVLCLVGLGMNVVATLHAVTSILAKRAIPVRMMSESATSTCITLVVDAARAREALLALHTIL
jgi:aspartokinase